MRLRQLSTTVAGLAMVLFAVGCSTVGEQFGFSPPVHKLIPEAKEFRDSTPAPPVSRELQKAPLPAFTVEPGDTLLVQPVELDAAVRLPADQTVLPDGTIELGVYGRPVVYGMTVPQVEAEVQRLVNAKEKTPQPVTVRLIGRQSKVYYVLGEVNSPGVFQLAGRETVLDGLMAAGGLNRQAAEGGIILSRPTDPCGCRVVLPVCYPQIVQLGDTSTNYQLQPGDRIYVPSKSLRESLFPKRNITPACCKLHAKCDLGAIQCPTPVACAPVPVQ